MSQDQKPPRFLDDPGFQAEIAALDRGLSSPVPPADGTPSSLPGPKSPRVAPGNPAPVESPSTPTPIFPDSTLAPEGDSPPASRLARGAAPAGIPKWADAAATPAAGGERPLLDLFPPPFGQRERAHPSASSGRPERPVEREGPAIVGAPPPQIVRSRLALEADASELPPTREQPVSASVSYDESVAAVVANLELEPQPSDDRSIVRIVGWAIVLLVLMLVGAAAAALVFQAQVLQLLSR